LLGVGPAVLLDPKSKFEAIADTTIADMPAFGLRVTESIGNPIDFYFDKETLTRDD
jgi:hypothetical protein